MSGPPLETVDDFVDLPVVPRPCRGAWRRWAGWGDGPLSGLIG
jgi:hypothetical protein